MTGPLSDHLLITSLTFWFLAKCSRWNSLQTQNCSHTWPKKGALTRLLSRHVGHHCATPATSIPQLSPFSFSVDCYSLTLFSFLFPLSCPWSSQPSSLSHGSLIIPRSDCSHTTFLLWFVWNHQNWFACDGSPTPPSGSSLHLHNHNHQSKAVSDHYLPPSSSLCMSRPNNIKHVKTKGIPLKGCSACSFNWLVFFLH